MKRIILLFLTSFQGVFSQELQFDNGIYVEKPISSDTSTRRYSLDNISYKTNMVFIYDYIFIDKSAQKWKFFLSRNETSIGNPLNLANYNGNSDSIIDKIKLVVSDNSKILRQLDPDYTQTVFDLVYVNKKGKRKDTICDYVKQKHKNVGMSCVDESSGVIDNKKNLWIHPPREYTFKILELNPFPFYYLDEKISHWAWSLEVGGSYLDSRWIKWKENILVKSEYIRAKDEVLNTPMGKIKCKVTDGTGTLDLKNTVLKTYLKSYYNPAYGFVRLEYANIDGTKIVIQLIDVKR